MAIDASIIGGLRPIQIEQQDPLTQYGKALQLKALMNQGQQSDIALADDMATRQAFQQSGGDLSKARQLLMQGGQYKQVQSIDKTLLENREKQSTIDKNQQSIVIGAIAQHRDALANINTPEAAAAWVKAGHEDPVIGPVISKFGKLESDIAEIPTDPAAFQQWKQMNALGATKFIEANKPQITSQNLGGTERMVATPGLGGKPQVLDTTARTVSPDTQMFMNQGGNTGPLDLNKVSRADLEAAYRYNQDGTLPPNMGRGIQGAMQVTHIRNIAAALNQQNGVDPSEIRGSQYAFKGDAAAVNNLRKREVQVGANVKNFDFNSDQVLQLSQKLDRTGVPIVNAWLNAGRRSVTGNPDLAAFDVAVKTTVNEFAQIVSGTTAGATTEGEKKKAEALLNAQQTPEGIVSVINQMRVESANRMKSFAQQRAENMPGMNRSTPETPQPAAKTSFDSLPDPSQFTGKRIKGPNGIMRSNGKSWVMEK